MGSVGHSMWFFACCYQHLRSIGAHLGEIGEIGEIGKLDSGMGF